MNKKDCPFHQIKIPDEREVILTDGKRFPWKMDPHGYFLVKIEQKTICCGFVNKKHVMTKEFRGCDPTVMIKEITRQKLCNEDNLAYIAQELMIAKDCIDRKKKYIQR